MSESGERTLLPLRRPVPMACAVAWRGNPGIMPGAGIEPVFGMDDVRFTGPVIAWQGGTPFQVAVERAPGGEAGYVIIITGELSGSDPEPEVAQLPDAGTCAWCTRTIYFIEAALLALLVLQIRSRRRMTG